MNDFVKKVQSQGIVNKNNWLSPDDIQIIENLIKKLKPLKGDEKSTYAINIKMVIKKIFKMNFSNIFKSLYFIRLSKKLRLKDIAQEILKSKARLIRIDHFWSPQSDDPVIQWHVDNAYSGRKDVKVFNEPDKQAIKFFFYLTDVSSDNGCLSYIPYSHKIAYALKEGIYKGDIQYQTYWTLSDFRKIILKEKNYNYIKKKVDNKILKEFLNTSENILYGKIDEHLFDHHIKRGGAVIFDEAGVHKGSKTKLNDRMVLRFFYQRV
jgi:hypothetical protein